jgi:peptidoglycan/LPS O-acetylase OafA/YrhL
MKNKALLWLGKYSFGIYIMQRIPMIIMIHYMPKINSYLFVVISLVLTIAFAFGFTKLSALLTKIVFAKSSKEVTIER